MRFFYVLKFFGPFFEFHTLTGVPNKHSGNSQKFVKIRRVFDGFWAFFSIFPSPTIVRMSKSFSKIPKK